MTRLRRALALSLIFATSVLCICEWGRATEQTAFPQEHQHATIVQIQKDALALLARAEASPAGSPTIEAGGRRQVREVRSGGSYLSQNDLRAFYGVGAYTGAVNVEVRVPGGATWRWQGQPIDRVLKLTLDGRR